MNRHDCASPTSLGFLQRLRDPDEQQAWCEFWQGYEPLLRGVCRSLRLDSADAEDAIQEALVRIWRKLPEFERQRLGSFRNWLAVVTRNAAIKVLSKASRRERPDVEIVATAAASEENAGPADAPSLEQRELATAVLRIEQMAMERTRQRVEPHTWRAYEQCSVAKRPGAEVAAELKMHVGAVYRAVNAVRGFLKEEKRKAFIELFPQLFDDLVD